MKYTTSVFCLLVLSIAAARQPAAAQTPPAAYVARTTNALPAPSSTDDPQDSMLTIRKRVDEVNVLFIATDKHGKFVRNLTRTTSTFWTTISPCSRS